MQVESRREERLRGRIGEVEGKAITPDFHMT